MPAAIHVQPTKEARLRAARAEVIRRVTLAIDRLDVALQFSEGSPGVVPQALHAIHYIERGWADDFNQRDIPHDSPDFRLSHDEAEALAIGLTSMLARARQEKSTWAERS